MDTHNKEFGKTLKKIRENKRYTQHEISNHHMSRSNYSKMEKDSINPNVVKYFHILDYLDMNHDEFSFILNEYELSQKQSIIYLFKTLYPMPSLSELEKVMTLSKTYSDEQDDDFVKDIYYCTCAWYALLKEHDIDKAHLHAAKIWTRLKELDKLYLSEYYLLNRILFYFEIETALALADTAIEDLENYYPLQEAVSLRSHVILNISAYLMAHNQYEKALTYTELLLNDRIEDYDILTIGSAFVHQGVCMERLNDTEKAQDRYESAIKLFEVANRRDLVENLKKYPRELFNPYVHIQFR